jgi:hypothetical protein
MFGAASVVYTTATVPQPPPVQLLRDSALDGDVQAAGVIPCCCAAEGAHRLQQRWHTSSCPGVVSEGVEGAEHTPGVPGTPQVVLDLVLPQPQLLIPNRLPCLRAVPRQLTNLCLQGHVIHASFSTEWKKQQQTGRPTCSHAHWHAWLSAHNDTTQRLPNTHDSTSAGRWNMSQRT